MKIIMALMALMALMGCASPEPTATPAPTATATPTPSPTPTPIPERIANRTIVGACTGSMEPAITCLDLVYAWRGEVRMDDLSVGLVVGASNPGGTPYWHRIIGLRDGEVLTHGDGQFDADGWVSIDRIIGYVVEVEKNARPYNAELRDYVNVARVAYNDAATVYEETALTYCADAYDLSGCSLSMAAVTEIEAAYAVARRASCEYFTRANEALVENALEVGDPPPTLPAPATC